MSITKTEPMSEETYRRFALADPQGQWELYRGQLQEKPGMSVEHGDVLMVLAALLHNQIDRNEFRVRAHHARLRRSADTYYVPDVAVIPTPAERALREHPGSLDAYADPLPLVIEIWSPSTGGMTSTRSWLTISGVRSRDLARPPLRAHLNRLAETAGWRLYRVGLPRGNRASGIAA